MDHLLYPSTSVSSQEVLVRQSKAGYSYRVATTMAGQISAFKLTTSAGNSLEQPLRPGERISGVLTLDIPRPMQATQVVLEFTGIEHRRQQQQQQQSGSNKSPAVRSVKSVLFTTSLVVWKAQQKGVTASTVLSDGMHVYNFTCQMPFVNYPQNVKRAEYEISFLLEGKMYAPKDISGQHVVAVVERELFYAPLVTLRPPNGGHHHQKSSVIVETLCFEKKGKKGKPAVELRATLNSLQVVPGTNLKLDISLKELTSATWTKVVAHLFERTVCRDDADMALWSADCELANADLVRASVYNFFLTDDIIGSGTATSEKTKTANGGGEAAVTSTEQLIFHVPRIPCSPLSTEHLEFSHFLRIEVFLPGWLSSDRSVYTDVPVQLMTCDLSTAALLLNHQASIASIIDHRGSSRSAETDNMSVISGRSSNNSSARPQSPQSTRSAAERSITMTAQSPSVTLSSLPPRYCDIHPADQRPAPTLVLLAKHAANDIIAHDAGSTSSMIDYHHHQQPLPQRLSRQSQSSTTRHTTLSSVQ
ncbi:hypothetical protein GGH95_001630, partial [Coemansia sp. RSA 1836]